MTVSKDLVISLGLDGRDFIQGAKMSERALEGLAREAKYVGREMEAEIPKGFMFMRSASQSATRELGNFTGSTGKASRGLLELSRGAEDFAVSFGTGGIAGGLRGAANNISQFAAMMNPLAGAITGLGVAAVSMWMAFSKGAEDAKEDADEVKERIDAMKKSMVEAQDQARQELKFRFDIQRESGEITDREALDKELRAEQATLNSLRRNLQKGTDIREMAQESLDQEAADPFSVSQAELEHARQMLRDIPQEYLDGLSEAIRESRKKIEELTKQVKIDDARQKREAKEKAKDDQKKAFETARKLREQEEQERQAALEEAKQKSVMLGRGALTGLHATGQGPGQTPSTPAGLPSIAMRGSSEAARAIAEAKNQSNVQKEQLAELKGIREDLKEASQAAQDEIVVESFSNVA